MLPASLSAKWLPREFVETTAAGGVCTLVAYVVMLVLLCLQISTFLGDSPSTSLDLEQDVGKQLQINFDIEMYDIECRNLRVAVLDPHGKEEIRQANRDFQLMSVGLDGNVKSVDVMIRGPEEEEELNVAHTNLANKLESEDGKGELDADWASSHDGFKHNHFDHVIEYHDFTVMNFFAEWCVHCRQFSPLWGEIAQAIHEHEYKDHGGHKREVKALKMNCVDFKPLCREQGIDEFPTIRIYRSDGSSSRFEGHRTKDAILAWVGEAVDMKADGWARNHKELQTGCRAQGHLIVPRTPGYLELFAGAGSHALDPSLTNVSHHVRHLSFSDPRYRAHWFYLPDEVRRHTQSMDGEHFCTHKFHETFEHHLMLVGTFSSRGQHYQFSHSHRISRSSNKSEVPQAKFNFDIESFGVRVENDVKRWYEFLTSTMAIMGGTFVMMKLFTLGSRAAAKSAVRSFSKKQRGRAALDTMK